MAIAKTLGVSRSNLNDRLNGGTKRRRRYPMALCRRSLLYVQSHCVAWFCASPSHLKAPRPCPLLTPQNNGKHKRNRAKESLNNAPILVL